jgi:hypothetical protein
LPKRKYNKTYRKKNNFMTLVVFVLAFVLFMNAGNYITGFAGGAGWNSTESQVTEAGTSPNIDNIQLNTGAVITPLAGTTTNIICSGDVTDQSGVLDIQNGKGNVTVYDSSAVSSSCSLNPVNCYKNTTFNSGLNENVCTGSGQTATCSFIVPIYWNANDSIVSWKCHMEIEDEGGNFDSDDLLTGVTMDTLLAIDIESASLAFGTLAPGAFSDNQTMMVYNYGNRIFNLSLNGSAMGCDAGESIGAGNITYNLTGAILDASWGTNLTTTSTETSYKLWPNMTIVDAVPNATSNNTWWKLYLPVSSEGARGSCTGTIWFVATDSE